MKKTFFLAAIAAISAVVLTSCGGAAISVVPQATNTIATVSFNDLNLERNDYMVMNTISTEVTLTAQFSSNEIKIADPNGEFEMSWIKNAGGKDKEEKWAPNSIKGILCLGYLSNDNGELLSNVLPLPHWIARRLAIYRLINEAKIAGGDGVIEPVVSTNIGEVEKSVFGGKQTVVYKTTVSAKVIKLKTN
ncbi:MAG: hypothetical protein KBT04_01105 [Bacteroidales bacterium]|nr:hypothetical protein [Candidatus Colimorpha onthohippi]